MADYGLDANILLRLSNAADPLYLVADTAIATLKQQGHSLHVHPQCFYEFWSVATRPASSRGGLGLTPAQAEIEITRFCGLFVYHPDLPVLFDEWRRLVNKYGVSGVNAHDTRLVAALLSHGFPTFLPSIAWTSCATQRSQRSTRPASSFQEADGERGQERCHQILL